MMANVIGFGFFLFTVGFGLTILFGWIPDYLRKRKRRKRRGLPLR